MKKILLIAAMAIVMTLMLSGCRSTNPDYDPYFGTEGLEIAFFDNAPPDTAYERQQLPIGLTLKNRGAYDIEEGALSIAVEDDYVTKPVGDSMGIILKGRSQYDEVGEEQTKMFYSNTKALDSLSAIHENSKIIVSACYKYRNMLKANICIDPDVYHMTQGEKPCTVEKMSFSGQGSPVAVTSIEEIMSKDEENGKIIPAFEITIENMGQGKVIDSIFVNSFCGSNALPENSFNKVFITADIGENDMECMPNPIRIGGSGSGKTICRLESGLDSTMAAYTTLMGIDLDYGYTFSLSKGFTIEKMKI